MVSSRWGQLMLGVWEGETRTLQVHVCRDFDMLVMVIDRVLEFEGKVLWNQAQETLFVSCYVIDCASYLRLADLERGTPQL